MTTIEDARKRQNDWKIDCPHKRGTWGWAMAHPPVFADVARRIEVHTSHMKAAVKRGAVDVSAIATAIADAKADMAVCVAKWEK